MPPAARGVKEGRVEVKKGRRVEQRRPSGKYKTPLKSIFSYLPIFPPSYLPFFGPVKHPQNFFIK
jgi:hypothetical protein